MEQEYLFLTAKEAFSADQRFYRSRLMLSFPEDLSFSQNTVGISHRDIMGCLRIPTPYRIAYGVFRIRTMVPSMVVMSLLSSFVLSVLTIQRLMPIAVLSI